MTGKRKRIVMTTAAACIALLVGFGPMRKLLMDIISAPLTLTRTLGAFIVRIPELPELKQQNADLRESLVRAQLEVAQLHESLRQAVHTRQLLDFAPVPEGVIARIIGRSPIPTQQVVLIDRGGQHGIELGSVAVDVYGVVGRVVEHAARSASLMLITDADSRIAAYIERSRESGLLVGMGAGQCELLYLDSNSNVSEGDEIYTAGLGGPFPKGLLLGKVVAVQRDALRGTARAIVRPAASIKKLQEVYCFAPATTVTVM